MSSWKELKKVAGQLHGSQNMFGYRSTEANQLYLLYCFSGKFYFTDKIDKRIKYLWYGLVAFEIFTTYTLALACLWFDADMKYDLMVMFYFSILVGSYTMAAYGLPLISYLFADDIEAMIELVDDIRSAKIRAEYFTNDNISMKKVFYTIMMPTIIFSLAYLFVSYIDVVLFFEEQKVKNPLYYSIPIPLIRTYGSFGLFFILNCAVSLIASMFVFEVVTVLILMLYWNTICRNELIGLREYLDAGSRRLNEYVANGNKTWSSWNKEFESILQNGVQQFQKIILLVDYLRGFVEVIGSVVVSMAFVYGIALLYICSTGDLLLILKLKYLFNYLATAFPVFQFYWMGEKLNNSIFEVSMAAYSTPWYWSNRERKNIYLLLCQTQRVKTLAAIRVHELLLKNFSRYVQGLWTYTNFLRKFTTR